MPSVRKFEPPPDLANLDIGRLSPLMLNRVVTLQVAAFLSSVSAEVWKSDPELKSKIVHLSARRLGVRLGDALYAHKYPLLEIKKVRALTAEIPATSTE
jgi:hypothetical protein